MTYLYRATYAAPHGPRRMTYAAQPSDALYIAAEWALSDELLAIAEVRPIALQTAFNLEPQC